MATYQGTHKITIKRQKSVTIQATSMEYAFYGTLSDPLQIHLQAVVTGIDNPIYQWKQWGGRSFYPINNATGATLTQSPRVDWGDTHTFLCEVTDPATKEKFVGKVVLDRRKLQEETIETREENIAIKDEVDVVTVICNCPTGFRVPELRGRMRPLRLIVIMNPNYSRVWQQLHLNSPERDMKIIMGNSIDVINACGSFVSVQPFGRNYQTLKAKRYNNNGELAYVDFATYDLLFYSDGIQHVNHCIWLNQLETTGLQDNVDNIIRLIIDSKKEELKGEKGEKGTDGLSIRPNEWAGQKVHFWHWKSTKALSLGWYSFQESTLDTCTYKVGYNTTRYNSLSQEEQEQAIRSVFLYTKVARKDIPVIIQARITCLDGEVHVLFFGNDDKTPYTQTIDKALKKGESLETTCIKRVGKSEYQGFSLYGKTEGKVRIDWLKKEYVKEGEPFKATPYVPNLYCTPVADGVNLSISGSVFSLKNGKSVDKEEVITSISTDNNFLTSISNKAISSIPNNPIYHVTTRTNCSLDESIRSFPIVLNGMPMDTGQCSPNPTLTLPDAITKHEGDIYFLNNKVDRKTGEVRSKIEEVKSDYLKRREGIQLNAYNLNQLNSGVYRVKSTDYLIIARKTKSDDPDPFIDFYADLPNGGIWKVVKPFHETKGRIRFMTSGASVFGSEWESWFELELGYEYTIHKTYTNEWYVTKKKISE